MSQLRRGFCKERMVFGREPNLGLSLSGIVAFALIGLAFPALSARAEGPVPVGAEIEVATGLPGIVFFSIASGRDGSFLVAWDEEVAPKRWAVWVRHYPGSGFPPGPAIRLAGMQHRDSRRPELEPMPNGGFGIAWRDGEPGPHGPTHRNLHLGRLDPEGNLVHVLASIEEAGGQFRLSIDSGGRMAAGWTGNCGFFCATAQVFDPLGEPMHPAFELGHLWGAEVYSILLTDSGEVAIAWSAAGFANYDSVAERRYLDGTPVSEPFRFPGDHGDQKDLSLTSDGDVLVVWNGASQEGLTTNATELHPSGESSVLSEPNSPFRDPSVVGLEDGGFMIAGLREGEPGLWWPEARYLDSHRIALGDAMRLSTEPIPRNWSTLVRLANSPRGRTTVNPVAVWNRDVSQDGSGLVYDIVVRRMSAPCVEDSRTLCLGTDDRFRVRSRWIDFVGQEGIGYAEERDRDWGTFWFFNEDNLELAVKVLDGQPVNGNHWVFYASLSNVEYELEVLDTFTGHMRLYQNASGEFASVGDDAAFPGDSGVEVASLDEESIVLDPSEDLPSLGCEPSEQRLCLLDGRFAVEVTWEAFDGRTGVGGAIPLTSDTGELWFFRPGNPELLVKVLDGGGVNGHYWVFYGALTNVAFEMTVRDTVTGAEQTYSNPLGEFASVGDVVAFPR